MYVISRGKRSFRGFVITAGTNMFIMIGLSIVAFKRPDLVQNLDLSFLLWILSGFVLVVALLMKIIIFIRVYRKTKQPEYYHLNYFGKKVFHKGLVTKAEFLIVLITMPFFLLIGSYFVAQLINFIRLGRF